MTFSNVILLKHTSRSSKQLTAKQFWTCMHPCSQTGMSKSVAHVPSRGSRVQWVVSWQSQRFRWNNSQKGLLILLYFQLSWLVRKTGSKKKKKVSLIHKTERRRNLEESTKLWSAKTSECKTWLLLSALVTWWEWEISHKYDCFNEHFTRFFWFLQGVE